VRVQLIDIPAVTPPYDHALAGALARAGAEVELITSPSPFGVAADSGYRVEELFYRRGERLLRRGDAVPDGWRRRAWQATKPSAFVAGMARLRRMARRADVVHYQWLGLEELAAPLLPPARPRVWTAHDVLPREPRPRQRAAFGRLMQAMDAVVVHSEHGAARLRDELGIEPGRIRVIPHGAFDHLERLEDPVPLPPELQDASGPVILFFGFLSPYKGLDLLLEAFASVRGAELWVVGAPRVDMEELRALAAGASGRVRFVPRFVPEPEIPAFFRRADVVALPYREIDQSGVLYTALPFGKPLA
jgi:glycosyltransferase involved in cell wall biosynthesis